MKSTGVVRKVDPLGRIVLPIELRRNLEIKTGKEKGLLNPNDGDSLEIYIEGQNIVLSKYQPSCVFCGEASGVTNYKGKKVCQKCMKEIKSIKE